MSDFLKKFDNENYKKLVNEKKAKNDKSEIKEAERELENDDHAKKEIEINELADETVVVQEETLEPVIDDHISEMMDETSTVQEQELDSDIEIETYLSENKNKERETNKRVEFEEEVVIDSSYHKKKTIQYAIIGVSVVALCITAFLLFRLVNQVTVPDFLGEQLSQAQTWAVKNKIELKTEREYNMEYDSNIIFEQSKDADKKIQKGSVMTIKVSDGADPNEHISIPDFNEMSRNEIENWKNDYKAENIKIVLEYSEEIEMDKFIRFEIKDTSITNDTYRRKDIATIYISKGMEVFEKNITVPNFKDKSKAEVEQWVQTNSIKMTYIESDSDTVMEGCIISQSIAANEKVAKNDEMSVYVSIGKAAVVPNFYNIIMSEASIYADNAGITLIIKEQFSASVSYGQLISQSVSAGKKLTGDSKIVTVTYSIGKPYIGDLTLSNEKDLQSYFYDFTTKGASITYSINYVDSVVGTKGNVISSNYYNEFVSMNAHVVVNIGKGNIPIE